MLTHDQIIASKFVRIAGGGVVDMNPDLPNGELVMTEQSVGKEYYNLLRSAGLLYQTLELQMQALQKTIDAAEEQGFDSLVPPLLQLQTGLNLAKRVALEGVESVAHSLQNKEF